MSEDDGYSFERLRHMFLGYRVSAALYVAAILGIADRLASGPRSAVDLANDVGVRADPLARVLRLLASEGVLTETAGGFALTAVGEFLRADVAQSLRPLVLVGGSEALWNVWSRLLEAVRTGRPAFDEVHGAGLFAYLQARPDELANFDALMTAYSVLAARSVAAAYDFAPLRTLVDVGGGRGALLIGLLQANPHLRGIVFDQPATAAEARKAIEAAGLGSRCEAVAGDFFDCVPEGGDACLLKFVLHDWDDERSVAILQSCRRSLPNNGRVLVIELLIPPGERPSFARSQDVNMLALAPGGRERSEAEYAALLQSAGFRHTRTIPTAGDLHVIEATAA